MGSSRRARFGKLKCAGAFPPAALGRWYNSNKPSNHRRVRSGNPEVAVPKQKSQRKPLRQCIDPGGAQGWKRAELPRSSGSARISFSGFTRGCNRGRCGSPRRPATARARSCAPWSSISPAAAIWASCHPPSTRIASGEVLASLQGARIRLLDDVHLLADGPEALGVLQEAIARTPERWVVAGRWIPEPLGGGPFPQTWLTEAELAFSIDEVAAALGVDPGTAAQVHRRTRGWPMAIALLAQPDADRPLPERWPEARDRLFEELARSLIRTLPEPAARLSVPHRDPAVVQRSPGRRPPGGSFGSPAPAARPVAGGPAAPAVPGVRRIPGSLALPRAVPGVPAPAHPGAAPAPFHPRRRLVRETGRPGDGHRARPGRRAGRRSGPAAAGPAGRLHLGSGAAADVPTLGDGPPGARAPGGAGSDAPPGQGAPSGRLLGGRPRAPPGSAGLGGATGRSGVCGIRPR
jgi:hypothetical protein